CVENCLDKVNFQKRIVLEPLCTGCSQGTKNVTWKLEKMGLLNETSKQYQFIIQNLAPNAVYTLLLEMSFATVEGDTTILNSTKIIKTTIQPSGGPCSVSPNEGYNVITSFTITCPDYIDINGLKDRVTYNLFLLGNVVGS
ncbi:hypothetical protein ACJMK2_005065, partial [Sinanodonta woodiana]